MSRHLPRPWLSAALALCWLLLAGSWTGGSVLLAVFLGWGLVRLLDPLLPETGHVRRPLLILPYLAIVCWDIFVGSITVARQVLFLRREAFRPAWIRVPVSLESPVARAILAGTITLTPGTLSADGSGSGDAILVHCLHAPDPEAVARDIATRYHDRLKEIFG